MNLLIVGLGNPDKKYELNRHNVGFQFVDYLLKNYVARFTFDKYFHSDLAKITLHSKGNRIQVVLVKPQTYMNRSGEAVSKLLASSTTHPPTLFVIHDDLDIRLGNFKIQKGVGPKVHNGLESIESSLKTKDFWRIRIGIDNRDSDFEGSGEGYVLSNFEDEELSLLQSIFPKIKEKLLTII